MSSDRKQLLALLRERQVKTVTAEYSGSSDEGYIDEISFEPEEPSEAMRRDLDDFFWDLIQSGPHEGYHNNDGGYGTMKWDIVADKITQQHNDYIQEIQEHPEFEIVDEDEDEEE